MGDEKQKAHSVEEFQAETKERRLSSIQKAPKEQCYYSDYIQLNKILEAQTLLSEKAGNKKHDEMLFIIIHQTYELWFKQVLFELGSVIEIFKEDYVSCENLYTCTERVSRVTQILKLLIEQVSVLETMQPYEFLEFREYLFPASGFQSWQFRLLENKLGINPNRTYKNEPYYLHFRPEHQEIVTKAEKEPSLFQGVMNWLERIPFLSLEGFDFWQLYKSAVTSFLDIDKEAVIQNQLLSEQKKNEELAEREKTIKLFNTIMNEEEHNEFVKQGRRKLSFKATQSALLIFLYKSLPALQLPYKFLTLLMDIDELLNTWRHRHMAMAHRMLGSKMGTGGSSGVGYLNKTVVSAAYRVFPDLFDLSTFLLPTHALPSLPKEVMTRMKFVYEQA
eukprot:TRINITY_DN1814_c0_g1_i1.p1 TRINITY_DN1814_c0_g1~~TRINITY_DN1814_c0_g1_i1.p1  ORF type:complete len:428 (+),score=96.53 TRINITY_DN1814_c0_g1_i1:112-1284(+)